MTIQDEVRALLAAATPGPWAAGECWVYTPPIYPGDPRLMNVLGMHSFDPTRAEAERDRGNRNAALIARAPELLATLCDKLDEAEAEARRLRHIANVNGDWNEIFLHEQAIKDEAVACAEKAEAAIQRVRDLADWHKTKAYKARQFPGGDADVMEKAAQVHDDAARRLLAALDGE